MYGIILTSLLSLPIFPLNPAKQDTLNSMNLHITVGMASPSELLSIGPEFTIKYEFLFEHPFLLRTGLDYRYGRMNQLKYPKGDYHGFTTSAEALYYRGTNRMTGFVGGGIIYNISSISLDSRVADSILAGELISDVRLDNHLGYRLIFGLRRSRLWSFELRVTDVRTKLVYQRELAPYRYSLEKQKVKLSDIRISFGYLLPLRRN